MVSRGPASFSITRMRNVPVVAVPASQPKSPQSGDVQQSVQQQPAAPEVVRQPVSQPLPQPVRQPVQQCGSCGQTLETLISQHVCTQCGMPQPVSAAENYFNALGVPVQFAQDRATLEKRFYELSRVLHPDR